jgi:hypothetical protein
MGLIAGTSGLIVQVEIQPPVGDGKPINGYGGRSIIDTGIRLYHEDAPGLEATDDEMLEASRPICVHCVLKSHPTIGRALQLAKRHGRAVWKEGRWCPSKAEWRS